jgi:hypothetical protein
LIEGVQGAKGHGGEGGCVRKSSFLRGSNAAAMVRKKGSEVRDAAGNVRRHALRAEEIAWRGTAIFIENLPCGCIAKSKENAHIT